MDLVFCSTNPLCVFSWLLLIALTACAANTVTETATETAVSADVLPSPELIGEDGLITYYKMTLADNAELEYGVVLPQTFDVDQVYPILLALPPGAQSRSMVAAGIDGYWGPEAQERSWIVISPIAPHGRLFFEGSEALIPEFLGRISKLYHPQGDKFHLAGVSNGGISAFRIAVNNPELFHSLTVLPGFPQAADMEQLEALRAIPVAMFVGEQDLAWIGRMKETEEVLSGLGGRASLEIVPGQGHVIQSLGSGDQLFDLLESFR